MFFKYMTLPNEHFKSKPRKTDFFGVIFFFFLTKKISIWPKNVTPGLRGVQIKRDTLQLLPDSVCNVELTDH